VPGAALLLAPPEVFRVGLPSRVEGVLFSSMVACSRDTLIFTAEGIAPLPTAHLQVL